MIENDPLYQQIMASHQREIQAAHADLAQQLLEHHRMYGDDALQELTRRFLSRSGPSGIQSLNAAIGMLHQSGQMETAQGIHAGAMEYLDPPQTVEQMEQDGAQLRHYQHGGAVHRVMRQARDTGRHY